MITLLSKLIIKNYNDYASPSVRLKYGMLCGAVGIFFNILLFTGKILAGTLTGSIGITADAFNNLSDAGSSIITLVGFRLSDAKADKEHPFGHGRLEYINATVMAAIILYVGITLFIESAHKISNPTDTEYSPLIIISLTLGIIGKLFLAWQYKKTGKEINSESFNAYSADSLSDLLSTSSVLAATLVESFFHYHIDGYMGVLMSLVILWTGYTIMKKAVNSIMGSTPDPEIYESIKNCILGCKGVYGVHDLIVHDYGPENHFATAHVELDSSLTFMQSHELSENVTTVLREKLNIQAVIHADPKAVSNPREAEYQRDLEAAIYRSGLPLSYHDFFVQEKEGEIDLSFELALTGYCKLNDGEIYHAISDELRKINPAYHIETMIDRNFISGKIYGND